MKVLKYQLKLTDEPQVFHIPVGGKVLTTQVQYDVICIWVLCDDTDKLDERSFYVRGTGHHVPNQGLRYVGTVQQMDGRFVWHIFEDIGHGKTA